MQQVSSTQVNLEYKLLLVKNKSSIQCEINFTNNLIKIACSSYTSRNYFNSIRIQRKILDHYVTDDSLRDEIGLTRVTLILQKKKLSHFDLRS